MVIIITITGLSTIPGVREQSSNSKDWINTLVSPICSRDEVVDSPNQAEKMIVSFQRRKIGTIMWKSIAQYRSCLSPPSASWEQVVDLS